MVTETLLSFLNLTIFVKKFYVQVGRFALHFREERRFKKRRNIISIFWLVLDTLIDDLK